MPNFQIIQCYAEDCRVFQVQQAKKVQKWKCVVCGEKQSLLRVYFESQVAGDCRARVQELNLNRGQNMSEAAQVSIQRTRQPDTKKRRSLPAGPPPSSARVPDAPSWDMYLDGSDEEDAGHSFLDPAEVVAPSKGKRKRNQPTDPLPNSAMPSDFRSSHTASGLRDGSNHSRPVLAGRRNPVPSRATSTDYGSNVTPLAGRRDPIPSRGTTTDYESNETTSAPKSYLSADRHKFARNVISSQSKPVPVIPSLPPSAPPSIVVKKPYHPSSTDRRTPAQPTVSSGWGDFLDASEGEASSSESEWSQEEDIIQL